jgi:hypothetical protein
MMMALVIMAMPVIMHLIVHLIMIMAVAMVVVGMIVISAAIVIAMRVPRGMVAAMTVRDERELRCGLGAAGIRARLRRIAGSEVVRSLRIVRHCRSIPS